MTKLSDGNFIIGLLALLITVIGVSILIGKYVNTTEVSQMQTTSNIKEIRSLMKSSGDIKTDVAIIKSDIKNINRSLEVLLRHKLVEKKAKTQIAKGE